LSATDPVALFVILKSAAPAPPSICNALPFCTTGVVPIPTLPLASTTKGVLSGLVESYTNNALPVPSCVIRRAALVLSVTETIWFAVKVLVVDTLALALNVVQSVEVK